MNVMSKIALQTSAVLYALISLAPNAVAQEMRTQGMLAQGLLAQGMSSTAMQNAMAGASSTGAPNLQNGIAQAVDNLVIQELTAQNVPGYALAVIKNGQLVVHRGYGFADLQSQQPVTPQTVFGLASLTKTFTAMSLLTLVDEGKIGLDDPLDKYVGKLSPPYQKLTIRQLASMTAGVPKELSREVDWKNQLPILCDTPLVSEPGTAFLYSNFSFRLLGDVIEKVTGKPYFKVVKERIFTPLQMNSSATTVDLASSGQLATPYGDNMGRGPLRVVEYKNPAISFSAGMLASTVDDLLKYSQAMLAQKILAPAGYQTMFYNRPLLPNGSPSNWAFGWSSKNEPKFGTRVIAMNGGTPGVASAIILLPEKNSAVVALCNLRKPQVAAIAHKVAALVFANNPAEAPLAPEPEAQGE